LFKKNKSTHTPSRKRATILQAVGGYINTGIIILQGLLLMPLYIHYLGADTYGLWLASGGILGMLGLINFGISSMLVQRIASAYGKNDLAQAGAYFINGMVVYLSICVLLGGFGWALSIILPMILTVDGEIARLLQQCFRLAVLAVTIAVFNECLRSCSQALLRPVRPHVNNAIGRILGISISLWMLLNSFGLWSIPLGMLVSESVIFTLNSLNVVSLFRNLNLSARVDKNIVKEFCRTGPALFLATAGNRVAQEADPLLITIIVSPEITTAYMVTRRAADVVFQMLNVLVGSIMGTFSHLTASGEVDRVRIVVKKLLALSFSLGVIGFATYVATNQAFVKLWVGETVILDKAIVLFVAIGFFSRTFRGMLSQILYELSDFKYASIVVLIEGVARVVLSAILLVLFGVVGIPIALSIICIMVIVVLGLRLMQWLKMKINLSAIARLLISAVVLFGVSYCLSQDVESWFYFVILLAGVLGGLSMLYVSINLKLSKALLR
jgi:O-antigen/teichoic acid export membrane protein